ncbi:MAG: hypothetical protein AAGA03_12230, partial [Planctomycetota bacterium]
QEQIGNAVKQVSERLERAARHRDRLDSHAQADQLQASAERVTQSAGAAADQAQSRLQQMAGGETDESSDQLRQSLSKAQQAIADQADQLRQLAQEHATASQQPVESTVSPQQQSGERLAQVLDELDRALHPSQATAPGRQPTSGQLAGSQQSSQPGDSPKGQTPSSAPDQSSDPNQLNAPEQPGGQRTQSQPGGQEEAMKAGEASQTLQDALADMAQQAARQRQDQFQSSSKPGSSSSSSKSPLDPQGDPGMMPMGQSVAIDHIDRKGDDWAQLRLQRTEDVVEANDTFVAPQYRREIEAYFEAVSKRASQ